MKILPDPLQCRWPQSKDQHEGRYAMMDPETRAMWDAENLAAAAEVAADPGRMMEAKRMADTLIAKKEAEIQGLRAIRDSTADGLVFSPMGSPFAALLRRTGSGS